MSHKLLIKKHKKTGLKYLCYTQQKDHNSYTGSGKYWVKHIKKHGIYIETQLIFETENYDEFKQKALNISQQLNVVLSNEWANLRDEDGIGGNTVSNKMWITDGTDELYIEKDNTIPLGWKRGRSKLKCKFSDIEFQKQMSKRSDRVKAGKSIKKAWDEGKFKRDHSKCGVKGNNNPSKRLEVRKKISEAQKQRSQQMVVCPHCGKTGKMSVGMNKNHFNNCKMK